VQPLCLQGTMLTRCTKRTRHGRSTRNMHCDYMKSALQVVDARARTLTGWQVGLKHVRVMLTDMLACTTNRVQGWNRGYPKTTSMQNPRR
jgi:hypothetical protein